MASFLQGENDDDCNSVWSAHENPTVSLVKIHLIIDLIGKINQQLHIYHT